MQSVDWNWINTTPFQSSHDSFGCFGSGLLLPKVSNHVFDRARIAFKLSIPSVIILSQSIELICNVIVCFSLSLALSLTLPSFPPFPPFLYISLSVSPISNSFHFSIYPLSSIHLRCFPLPLPSPLSLTPPPISPF